MTFACSVMTAGNRNRTRISHRLMQQDIQAEFWFVLLAHSFYQFAENQSLKIQLTGRLDALQSLDAAAARKALG
jgi:hypothetical protein